MSLPRVWNFRVERQEPSGLIQLFVTEERPSIRFRIQYEGVNANNVTMLALPNDKKVKASIQPVDAKGNPAEVQGNPEWSSSNDRAAIVGNIAEDGLSADIIGVDVGTCQVNVKADADLGEGVQQITGLLDVEVVGGTAVGLEIKTEAPVPQEPGDAPHPEPQQSGQKGQQKPGQQQQVPEVKPGQPGIAPGTKVG